MAIEWYYVNDYVALGVDWQVSTKTATVSIAPLVYRWDSNNTDNYGSKYSESLSPDPVGAGSWSGLSWGSGSGTRQINSFDTRTYNKGTGSVKLTLSWDSSFGSYYNGAFHTLGSGSHTWTYELPDMPTYTITYDANGGQLGSISKTQTKTHGTRAYVPSTKPTKTGYSFQGWCVPTRTDIDSKYQTEVYYTPGSGIDYNGNQTLKAVWTANTYTVTFNASGGSTSLASKTVTYDSTYGDLPTPTYTGFTFNGWYDKASGGTEITSSTKVSITENQTLYAQWTRNEYTLTLNANGGKVKGNDTYSYKVPYDYPIAENDEEGLPTPIRLGYNFTGWNVEQDGSGFALVGDSKMSAKDMTLYAQWEPAASIVTLYLPDEDSNIQKRRGMTHMYNISKKLCFAIMTIYDENGTGHFAN